MPKKLVALPTTPPDHFFVKELAGEVPPSFAALKNLYGQASDLYGLRPWRMLDESQLILVRDSVSGELCYCSVMGMIGEFYSMHAYIGIESYRLFRRLAAGENIEPGEFFATHRSVAVQYVPKKELEKPDRELLAAVGHPQERGLASPIFRAIRPGFHPWFVTQDEARTLTDCIAAVGAVCQAAAAEDGARFWDQPDTFPLVSLAQGTEGGYDVRLVKAILPAEPPVMPVQLDEETLRALRNRDYAVRGVMELDFILNGTPIGKKSERKASACFALAVDEESGMVLAPDISADNSPPAELLVKVFINGVQSTRTLPKEVKVRSQRLKESIAPLLESLGVTVRVSKRLPAADEARAHLLGFMRGGSGI
jgi:hypothetical protein